MEGVEIGIVNTIKKKWISKKILIQDNYESKEKFIQQVIEDLERLSEWFDKQDTFFSGKKIWKYWESVGITQKFKNAIEKKYTTSESISVFKNGEKRGEEHELYIKYLPKISKI